MGVAKNNLAHSFINPSDERGTMYKKMLIIAEVKTKSPTGKKSEKTWDELFKIANEVGDIISIHTHRKWGGSFKLLRKARVLTKKPILAKGIHPTDLHVQKAIDAGADWVLVVFGSPFRTKMPAIHLEKCLIEPTTLLELKAIPRNLKVVWNSRDLLALPHESFKTETFEEGRVLRKGWLCQASNIKTVADIKEGANAVLVGTYLLDFAVSLPQR